MRKEIIEMAEANSYEMIDRKLHEEIGELLQAKAKYDTALEAEPTTDEERQLAQKNIMDKLRELSGEIADVDIMLKELTCVLGINVQVKKQVEYKIDRQMKRIKESEEQEE